MISFWNSHSLHEMLQDSIKIYEFKLYINRSINKWYFSATCLPTAAWVHIMSQNYNFTIQLFYFNSTRFSLCYHSSKATIHQTILVARWIMVVVVSLSTVFWTGNVDNPQQKKTLQINENLIPGVSILSFKFCSYLETFLLLFVDHLLTSLHILHTAVKQYCY